MSKSHRLHQQEPYKFQGDVSIDATFCPELITFTKWVLAGDRNLTDQIDLQSDIQSRTIASNMVYNIKSDRQVNYKPGESRQIHTSHTDAPIHHIGLGVSLRYYDRNNAVFNLLSDPNYGLSPTPHQCFLWEMALANAIIDNMKNHEGIYIPPNMVKSILPMFHIDNIDWQEDAPDEKNTSQYILLCVFQRVPLTLDVDQKNTSLILKENRFNIYLIALNHNAHRDVWISRLFQMNSVKKYQIVKHGCC